MKIETSKYIIAGVFSAIVSLFLTLPFQNNMPMAEWFYNLENSVLIILSSLDLVFHEAGHWIYGILGVRFITIAGGTLMQLTFPVICLLNFYHQKNKAGILFSIFWLGENLDEVSWYMADAKVQALILITGMSGRESGGHDWGNMLGMMGLTDHCVGMAECVHWAGTSLMLFPAGWFLVYLWNRFIHLAQ
jgi:hypothetical protein